MLNVYRTGAGRRLVGPGPSLHCSMYKVAKLSATYSGDPNVLAIRREDGMQWERRAPLAPKQVKKLVQAGNKVLIQPSNKRAFTHKEYEQAGATIQDDISTARLIVGVKQVPLDKLIPNRTYVFFSHTIKAQEGSMAMLDEMLRKNIRLVDYECMTEANGKRVIAFGKWAGVAGMIDILHGVGLRLLALGHHTPFLHIGLAHSYRNSEFAKQGVRDAGYEIALGMMPESIGPLTVVFTGSGNVSQGAQEVFQQLPFQYVPPAELKYWAENGDPKRIYATVISRKDYLVHSETGTFDPAHYESHPEQYDSRFSELYSPYASIIVNGIFWAVNAPRLVRKEDLSRLLSPPVPQPNTQPGCPALPHRLIAVCDISADPHGSIEFTDICTTIDQPFAIYDSEGNRHDNIAGEGVVVCSVDNMPAQIPTEATEYFGSLLLPFIPDLMTSDANQPFSQWQPNPVIRNATIISNGKLTKDYEYIHLLRQKQGLDNLKRHVQTRLIPAKAARKHRVLVLGAGYVAPPCVDCLTRDQDTVVTLVSAVKGEAEVLAKRFPECVAFTLDVANQQAELDELVKGHDVVVSLLPWTMHGKVVEACVRGKKHMVTTSYLTEDLRAMQHLVQDAGISVVMEAGLDPGIDHMLAMEAIDRIRESEGRIVSFRSVCGGLPAPEYSNNPIKYRFSWSPKGVFLAANSPARYMDQGNVIEVGGEGAVLDHSTPVDIFPGLRLEQFPNRDSTKYIEEYNLTSCHTFFRGTLRYSGYAEIVRTFFRLGLLSTEVKDYLREDSASLHWRELMCKMLEANISTPEKGLLAILEKRGIKPEVQQAMLQMGLLSEEVVPPLNTPADALSSTLAQKYTFKSDERDFIVMRHTFEVERPNNQLDTVKVSMVQYGEPHSYSAMSKWVGLPCAHATKMILKGEVEKTGFVRPVERYFYEPLLKRLRDEQLTDYTEVTTELKR